MPDISKITLPNNDSYDIKDRSAIANITRNGTTFTATKRDGTTFTFTQETINEVLIATDTTAATTNTKIWIEI